MEGIETFGDALGLVLMMAFFITVFVLLIVFIVQSITGGRSLLYKFIQDYGYDHAITLGALEKVVFKILDSEGYDAESLSIGHEVGNRYNGSFYCRKDGYRHDIVVITDGWTVDYNIDNERTKRYKT